MTDIDSLTPTQDDRVMAALSHISAILPMMGVVAPIVIWVTQKDKSKYVAFQSLQALAFQLTMILAWFIGMGCYMLSIFSTVFTLPFADTSRPPGAILIALLIIGVISIGGIFYVVYGIVGAVKAFQGRPFRYLIIGNRVERFMQADQGPDASEIH